ncbi:hypothetical protein [Arthrobacter sp. NPDC093139]|uniref:hypothetical protein n=1 Tax=Arthrobacter sp. NPDC093139 TaxID=3363945 RepID=UPI0038298CCE
MIRIKIQDLYEECDFKLVPDWDWTVADQDKQLFTGEYFGQQGDAWATVITVHLVEENRMLRALVGGIDYFRPYFTRGVAEVLQLRVCSRPFVETDPRFLNEGRHRALIQERFDFSAAKKFCTSRIHASAHLDRTRMVAAWEEDFFVFDPSED